MAVFGFKVLTPTGEVKRGVVELPFFDPIKAINYLERKGEIVLNLYRYPEIIAVFFRIFQKGTTKVKLPILAEFFNNLAMLTKAGVPILSALEEVKEDTENKVLDAVLKFMIIDIESGQTLSEAMEKHQHIFSNAVLQMVKVGEETGSLDKMLKKSSEHLKHLHEIISQTKRALIYPAFLIVVVSGMSIFWFVFVIPKLVGLFKEMNVELPWTTKLLISISEFVQNYIGVIMGGGFVLVLLIWLLRRFSYQFRYKTDELVLKIPVIGRIINTSITAKVSEFLGIMLGAGIGIGRTLDVIIDFMKNEVYKKRISRAKEIISLGEGISMALRQAQALDNFALRMISIGEQSGSIEEQTEYVASVYREKLRNLVEVLGKTIEPALIVFIGIIFALIMGGLLFPIYDLMTKIR
ncbi:MAG: type II secretion system F family protein [Desulfonauticus sp.]|nr:type II secretion system F family protein [Desulfonauticus sp.]